MKDNDIGFTKVEKGGEGSGTGSGSGGGGGMYE